MKTKYFFRTSVDSLFLQVLVFLGLGIDIFACISSTYGIIAVWSVQEYPLAIFGMIFFYLGLPLLLYIELTFILGVIRLEDDGIYNNGDIRLPREKIQYPVFASYNEIISLSIVACRNASNGKHINISRPIPYLFVLTRNKSTKRFSLHFMSKKSVLALLRDIDKMCALHQNVLDIDIDYLMKSFEEARFKAR